MLMGLARKYLPPSVIAQLAPSSIVEETEEEDVCASRTCCEFSLASRRYMRAHGLLSGASEGEEKEGEEGASSPNLSSSSSSETVPRFMVLDETTRKGEESFLPCSRLFYSTAGEPSGIEVHEEVGEDDEESCGNYEAPILDLEHLRALPKLL